MSDLPPAHFLARIYTPVSQVWQAAMYDDPDAPPSQQAVALGQQLAARLLASQGVYVGDHRAKQMLYVSEGVERLLGYPAAEFAARHYDLIHPDDLPLVVEATRLCNQYFIQRLDHPPTQLLFSVDYRIWHQQGHYVRMLRQNIVLTQEANGAIVGVAGILTDITHHKLTTDVRFHMNLPDFPAFVRQQQIQALPVVLSRREQAVLALVLEGLTSAQIAGQLGLSPHTIITHRRNIKRKIGSHDVHRLLRHLDVDSAND
jgi:DNA-binding CsgD family transcriptional regulator